MINKSVSDEERNKEIVIARESTIYTSVRTSADIPKRAVPDRYRTCRGFLVLPVVDAGLRHFPDQRNQETSACLRIFFKPVPHLCLFFVADVIEYVFKERTDKVE